MVLWKILLNIFHKTIHRKTLSSRWKFKIYANHNEFTIVAKWGPRKRLDFNIWRVFLQGICLDKRCRALFGNYIKSAFRNALLPILLIVIGCKEFRFQSSKSTLAENCSNFKLLEKDHYQTLSWIKYIFRTNGSKRMRYLKWSL